MTQPVLSEQPAETLTGLVDCDVHAEPDGVQALLPYLPGYWVEQITNTVFKGPVDKPYPPNTALAVRPCLRPTSTRCA